MAYIEKRGPKRYRVRYRGPNGKEHSKTFPKKSMADAFATSMEESKLRGAWVNPADGKVKFGTFADEWWKNITHLRPSTRARDDSYLHNHVLPKWSDYPIGEIPAGEVRSWVAALSADYAPSTVRLIFAMLAKPMDAVEQDARIPSPCRNIKLPKIESDEMRFLLPTEVKTLAEAMDEKYRALVYLGAYAGLRRGELFGLRAHRLDLLHGTVDVVEQLVEVRGHITFSPLKTKAARRRIPIPRSVGAILDAHMEGKRGKHDLVFQSPDGLPVRPSLFRRRFWVPAVERAELLPLRLHDLRHTAVSFWIDSGVNAKKVASYAGHTSTRLTFDRYGHLFPEGDDGVRAALDVQFRAAQGPLRTDDDDSEEAVPA